VSDKSKMSVTAEPEEKAKVTKVVKMGSSTLLVIDLGADSEVAEGEYLLEQITVRPPVDVPSGADTGCSIRVDFCICKTQKKTPPKEKKKEA